MAQGQSALDYVTGGATPAERPVTTLSPAQEQAFQGWYGERAKTLGINPDPDDPRHHYDYRAAFQAGAEPNSEGHWPSMFKLEGHPNRYVGGEDTMTGKPVGGSALDYVTGGGSALDYVTGGEEKPKSSGFDIPKPEIPDIGTTPAKPEIPPGPTEPGFIQPGVGGITSGPQGAGEGEGLDLHEVGPQLARGFVSDAGRLAEYLGGTAAHIKNLYFPGNLTEVGKKGQEKAAAEPGRRVAETIEGNIPPPTTEAGKIASDVGHAGVPILSGPFAPVILAAESGKNLQAVHDRALAMGKTEAEANLAMAESAPGELMGLAPMLSFVNELGVSAPSVAKALTNGIAGIGKGVLGTYGSQAWGQMVDNSLTGEQKNAFLEAAKQIPHQSKVWTALEAMGLVTHTGGLHEEAPGATSTEHPPEAIRQETPPPATQEGVTSGSEPTRPQSNAGQATVPEVPTSGEGPTEINLGDRRAVERAGQPERRQNTEFRQQLDEADQAAALKALRLHNAGDETGALAVMQEHGQARTEAVAAEHASARTDELTGLPNRKAWAERDLTDRHVLNLDVDGLKWVNDNVSHEAGDKYIKAVADVIRQEDPKGVIARTGGDEFNGDTADAKEAQDIGKRIQDRLAGMSVDLGVDPKTGERVVKQGIGISFGHGESEGEADKAMYQNKADRAEQGLRRADNKQEPPGIVRTKPEAAPAPESAPPESAAKPSEAVPEPESGRAPAPAEEPAPERSPTSLKNRIVDEERVARGEQPLMTKAKEERGQWWNEAQRRLDENPQAADDILKGSPRPLDKVEQSILLRDKIEKANEFSKLDAELTKAKAAGDDAKVEELTKRAAALSDRRQKTDEFGRESGAEWGRSGVARQMEAYEDFSLAAMESRRRVANRGEPLNEKQMQEIRDLHEKLTAAQSALDAHMAAKEAAQSEAPKKIQSRAARLIEALDAKAEEARARLAAKRGRAAAGFAVEPQDIVDLAHIAASHLAHGINAGVRLVNDFGEWVKPHLEAIMAQARKIHESTQTELDEGARSQAKVKRLGKQEEVLKGKIETGNFAKAAPRPPIKLDAQGLALEARVNRLKGQVRAGEYKDQQANRTLGQKVQDTMAKWRRAEVLSSPNILAKLTSAGFERMAQTPAEEAIGAGISKLIPGIAGKSGRGNSSVAIEARALADGFTKGMQDAYQTLTKGQSDLAANLDERSIPHEGGVAEFLGNMHAALKDPTKRNEFSRSFAQRAARAIENGLDPTEPIVQSRIALDAYKDAQRSIFQQDNRLVDAYQVGMAMLKKYPATKPVSTVAEVMMPIVRIPTNFVAEVGEHALGAAIGPVRVAKAYMKGLESLTPAQAEVTMRLLKKGSLGAAGLLIGFLNPGPIGGYYQPGKRDEKDTKFGSVKVFGTNIPSLLLHNPLMETLQIGATARRVMDSKYRKRDPNNQGFTAGAIAAALGLLEKVPMVEEPAQLLKVFNPQDRQKAIGEEVGSIAVPSGVSWAARMLDRDSAGNQIERKPQTIPQYIEEGIPGMRKKVPRK